MVIERTVLESIDLIDAILTSHVESGLAMQAIRNLCYMLDVFGFDGLLKGFVDYFGIHTVTGEELVGFFGDLEEVNDLAEHMRGEDDGV